jgi:histidinol phosphatase-like PHP family hydrolase
MISIHRLRGIRYDTGVKLDLHVHSSEYSACAVATAETQIRAAIARGLDGIAFTNHHKLVPPKALETWNRSYAPFRIYGAIEITVNEGEDFLVFGIDDPSLESPDWEYRNLHELVRKKRGYIVLAHPFRYRQSVDAPVSEFPPDGVELHSSNTPAAAEIKIRRLTSRIDARLFCNSDAHSPDSLGRYYNLTKHPLPEGEDLASFLRSGDFKGIAH